jgi:hypothetical protein
VAYYGGFVPNLPSKLYDDPRVPHQEFGFDSLPQYHVAAVRLKNNELQHNKFHSKTVIHLDFYQSTSVYVNSACITVVKSYQLKNFHVVRTNCKKS